jgi:hypothetical protein
VADEMKAAIAIAASCHDRHRIVRQAVDMIIGGIARVRPRARRIAALTRRHRAIARARKCCHLCAPAMHGFGKAVQQQHQRRTRFAGDEGVEGQSRGGRDFFEAGHAFRTLAPKEATLTTV